MEEQLPQQRGSCRKQLGVLMVIVFVLIACLANLYSRIMLELKAKSALHKAYSIHQALFAYASSNGDVFPSKAPDGGDLPDANTAYRQLFIKGLIDDEKLFQLKGSAWHGDYIDGEIGSADDGFSHALTSGENAWGYVSGLTVNSEPTLPIVFDGGMEGSPGKWSTDPNSKGGVWKGRFGITVRIGGVAKVNELDPDELIVKDKKNGSDVDIFSDAYGTNTSNVLNPLGR